LLSLFCFMVAIWAQSWLAVY